MKNLPRDHIIGTFLGAIVGTVIGISANVIGWWNMSAFLAVLVLALAAAGTLRRANEKRRQVNRDDLDDDPAAIQRHSEPAAALTFDLTVGFHNSVDPAIYLGLTEGELANKLAEHAVSLPTNAIRGRHTRADGGLQLTWQPSTTDTTGETQ